MNRPSELADPRLLIVGVSHPGALETSYSRAFSQLGWHVSNWNPFQGIENHARGSRLGRAFGRYVHVEAWARKANLDLLNVLDREKPHLVLIIATEGLRAGSLAQAKVRHPEMLFYCVFPDTPHNLTQDRLSCLPLFHRIFVASPGWTEPFETLGGKQVSYLPLAADVDLYDSPASRRGHHIEEHAVSFIGIWTPQREEFLEGLADLDLQVWGNSYWRHRVRSGSPLVEKWSGRPAALGELGEISRNSKIMLNVIDAVGWPGPNMRVFEHAACKAFSLATRTPAVLELFTEGEEIECFDSVEEAREKISRYEKDPEARARVAAAAYDAVVRGGHTYLDRAKELSRLAAVDAGAIPSLIRREEELDS